MPQSDLWNVPPVLSWVGAADPSSILDVGVGFGKYGLLCREVLEVSRARYRPAEWRVRIEGIDVFPDYHTPLWDYAYNAVHLGRAEEVLPKLGRFDVALFCDVIEHLEKEAGAALLEMLLSHARLVIVTTPLLFSPQGDAFGNEAERHLSHWTPRDFQAYHHISVVAGQCLAVCASREPLPRAVRRAPTTRLGAGVAAARSTLARRARYFLHDHLPTPLKAPLKRALRWAGVVKE